MEMKTNMAMLAKSTRMLSVFSMMLSLCAMLRERLAWYAVLVLIVAIFVG